MPQDNTDGPEGREIEGQGGSAPALVFDCEKYRRFVEHYDLSDAQKQELLDTLWNMMVQIVDMGFGFHPIAKIMDELLKIEASDSGCVLSSKHQEQQQQVQAGSRAARPAESGDS